MNNLSQDRLVVLEKMAEFEKKGLFDKDCEIDPPAKELFPSQVDYLKRKFRSRLKSKYAFYIARRFMKKALRNDNLIIKEIMGMENINSISSGAILTCNHFNAMDSFAIQYIYEHSIHFKKKRFHRVIREGNYTSFPGKFGFFMRNCYTLPLSSNKETMHNFIKSVDTILQNGNLILVYPEQSLWWNYKKPKPLKKTAFKFAAKNNVPIIPCFITMEDSDKIAPDGSYIQEYTIHIEKPIYPDNSLDINKNTNIMLAENFSTWKTIYETTYKTKLQYETLQESPE